MAQFPDGTPRLKPAFVFNFMGSCTERCKVSFEGKAAHKGVKAYEPPMKASDAGSTPPQSPAPMEDSTPRMLTRETRPVEVAERAGSSARMAWPGGKMQVSDPGEAFARFFQNMVRRGVTPNPAQLQRAVELGIDSASSGKQVAGSSGDNTRQGKRSKRAATDRQRSKALEERKGVPSASATPEELAAAKPMHLDNGDGVVLVDCRHGACVVAWDGEASIETSLSEKGGHDRRRCVEPECMRSAKSWYSLHCFDQLMLQEIAGQQLGEVDGCTVQSRRFWTRAEVAAGSPDWDWRLMMQAQLIHSDPGDCHVDNFLERWGWCEAHGKPIQLGWQDEGWGDWDPEDNPAVSHGFTSRSAYQAVRSNGGGALLGNSIPLAEECCCDEDCRSSLMKRFCTELSRVEHAVGGSGKRRKTVSFAEPLPLPEPSMSVTGVRCALR